MSTPRIKCWNCSRWVLIEHRKLAKFQIVSGKHGFGTIEIEEPICIACYLSLQNTDKLMQDKLRELEEEERYAQTKAHEPTKS